MGTRCVTVTITGTFSPCNPRLNPGELLTGAWAAQESVLGDIDAPRGRSVHRAPRNSSRSASASRRGDSACRTDCTARARPP